MVGETQSKKQRNPLFDVAKFFAIALVVAGHVFNNGYAPGTPWWFSNFRDEMVMPLFFIVSGYFAVATIESGNWQKMFRHIRSYLQPLAVLGVAFTPCYFVCQILVGGGGAVLLSDILLYPIKRVCFAGWFVWVLSFSYVIAFLVFRLPFAKNFLRRVMLLLTASFLLYFAPRFPHGMFHVHYLVLMFPFFVVGIVWRRISDSMADNSICKSRWKVIGYVCFLAYLAVVLVGPAGKYGLSMYSGQVYGLNWFFSSTAMLRTLARIAIGVTGSFGTLAVIDGLMAYGGMAFFAPLGTTTLGVYLMHQWILDRILDFRILPGGVSRCIAVSFLLFAFCHLFVVSSKKNRILNSFLWGRG